MRVTRSQAIRRVSAGAWPGPGTTRRRRLGAGGRWALLPLMLALALTACGSSRAGQAPEAATPSANSAGAYLNCLLQHLGTGPGSAGSGSAGPGSAGPGSAGPGSARTACAPVRPADLAAVLLTFENCLKAHGVTVPSLPGQGRRAALLQFVGGLQEGSSAQRSALAACKPPGFPG